MSDTWLNIRFGLYHVQAGSPHWWSIRVSRNEYHVGNPKRLELHECRPFGWRIK